MDNTLSIPAAGRFRRWSYRAACFYTPPSSHTGTAGQRLGLTVTRTPRCISGARGYTRSSAQALGIVVVSARLCQSSSGLGFGWSKIIPSVALPTVRTDYSRSTLLGSEFRSLSSHMPRDSSGITSTSTYYGARYRRMKPCSAAAVGRAPCPPGPGCLSYDGAVEYPHKLAYSNEIVVAQEFEVLSWPKCDRFGKVDANGFLQLRGRVKQVMVPPMDTSQPAKTQEHRGLPYPHAGRREDEPLSWPRPR